MAAPTYTFEVDLDRDGSFAGDLTGDLTGAPALGFRAGMTNAADAGWVSPVNRYDGMPAPAHLEAVLDNSVERGRLFSPDNPASPFYGKLTRGALVRVRMIAGGAAVTLWTGKLQRLLPVAGLAESQTVTLVAEDQSGVLLDSNFLPTLQTNVTVDQAIQQVFDAGIVPWPYDKRWWILGASRLGRNTRLFGSTNFVADVARTTLPWVGDTSARGSGGGTSAQQYIRDLLIAEAGGRFFWDARNGVWAFHNRAHDALVAAVTDTLTAADFDLAQQRYGDDLVTRVIVYYQPRAVGTPASVLFSADNVPFKVAYHQPVTIQMRYRDPAHPTAQIGAVDVIVPQLGVDISATKHEDSGSDSRTYALGIGTTIGAQSTSITITNTTRQDVWVQLLQVRGTPLTRYNQEAAEAHGADERAAYDLQPLVINASQIGDSDTAQGVANRILRRFGTPITRYASIRLTANDSDRLRALVQNAAIGQKYHIDDATTGHAGDYHLIGEVHELTPTAHPLDPWLHRATWLLKPAATEKLWLLGRPGMSNLGDSTYVTF